MRQALVPLSLILFHAVSLALVRHVCTLLPVIWTALDGLAGLRIAQDHRPRAASKDNRSLTDSERVDGGDHGSLSVRRSTSLVGFVLSALAILRNSEGDAKVSPFSIRARCSGAIPTLNATPSTLCFWKTLMASMA